MKVEAPSRLQGRQDEHDLQRSGPDVCIEARAGGIGQRRPYGHPAMVQLFDDDMFPEFLALLEATILDNYQG